MQNHLIESNPQPFTVIDLITLDAAITKFLKEKNYSASRTFSKWGYESVAVNNWGNYQSHIFRVTPIKQEPNILLEDEISTLKLLNWMCAEDRIPEGNYIVNCSW